MEHKCFACEKPLKEGGFIAWTRDGQQVEVGSECNKRINGMQQHGYQPPKGGPRLYNVMLNPCDCCKDAI